MAGIISGCCSACDRFFHMVLSYSFEKRKEEAKEIEKKDEKKDRIGKDKERCRS